MPRTLQARAPGTPEPMRTGRASARRPASGARSPAVLRGPRSKQGKVFIVGAGPGDPELLTLRALRLMRQAEAVVYDRLVGKDILALIPASAQRIYAGKKSGNHSLPQDEINRLVLGLARRGMKVVRLKGGDPFIFGRGGEELQFIAEHGIPFEVVPGVTAASGAACYAGIPLTHRDYAQACVLVTGHPREGGRELAWSMLARPAQTVVIYMGLGQIREICAGLIEHGRGHDTPVAVVERATTDAQRVILGTLRTIAGKCTRSKVRSPSLIIVGEVVSLHSKLSWFVPAKAAAGRRKN